MPTFHRFARRCALTALAVTVLLLPGLQAFPQAARPAPQAAPAGDPPWPRVFADDGNTITIYQPQPDRWSDGTLEARAAVSIAKQATPAPTLGVIWLTARTSVDRESDLVAIDDVKVTRASFPSDPGRADEYAAAIGKHLPAATRTIALARLQASLAVSGTQASAAKAVPVKNDPPRIIFSEQPALLILIDGKPEFRPVQGTQLLRVVNTRALLVLDQGKGRYYLRALKGWFEAPATAGPWTAASIPPAALATALRAAGQQADLIDQAPAEIAVADGARPVIHVSETPAELIQTAGPPEFAPIPNTQLLYVNNTSSQIIIDPNTQDYYVLVSGRWFRSKALTEGPWTFVPSDKVPADFAKIPDTHPKGAVLSSVSGTPQAQDAQIDNQIPQTATVDRKRARPKVSYDGPPQLKPIEGTSLAYAVNSPNPVIRVSASSYYTVENGVWFTGPSLNGPWVVADDVPAVIYSIPPSSPLHYVTYVRVYGATPDVVYVGYTPGYFGTVLAPDGVVVYGTGYYYPGWIGNVWYPWPLTYGYGTGFAWGEVTGFTLGFIAGAAWHGGAWGWRWHGGAVFNNVNINNFNFNHANIYNRWTNNVVHSRIVHGGDRRPGDRLTPRDRGDLADRAKQGKRDAADRPRDRGQRHAGRANDHYAGKDGQVHRRGAQGWERHSSNGFRPHHGDEARHLDREQFARHHGEAIHRSRVAGGGFHGGFHGGGFRGGGFQRGGGFHGGFHGRR